MFVKLFIRLAYLKIRMRRSQDYRSLFTFSNLLKLQPRQQQIYAISLWYCYNDNNLVFTHDIIASWRQSSSFKRRWMLFVSFIEVILNFKFNAPWKYMKIAAISHSAKLSQKKFSCLLCLVVVLLLSSTFCYKYSTIWCTSADSYCWLVQAIR